MPPSNNAVFLLAYNLPLKLRQSVYTKPSKQDLLVKNAAFSINPYDCVIQRAPDLVVSWVKLPCVLGVDVASEVIEVGKGVTKFIAQLTMSPAVFPNGALGMPYFLFKSIRAVLLNDLSARKNGLSSKIVNGSDLIANEVRVALYNAFLPGALQQKKSILAPEAQVVGNGLGSVQKAMDLSKKECLRRSWL
ncbi:hypothetical protein BJ878DRAFT_183869 [Calycina marina]|uniref:Alcohol dehydrogenase-like N-terminal domain-containing protein n=1 Tax=Calycina marina TaxID=1763456 RepID=A0A9P7YYT9_9HELO|nr:hypothetical protein BJ878DRAFT_183869 [Calycina marina]